MIQLDSAYKGHTLNVKAQLGWKLTEKIHCAKNKYKKAGPLILISNK